MGERIYFDNYSPTGDIIVIAICLVIFVLVSTSYVAKTRSFSIFINIVVFLILASYCDVIHHRLYIEVTNGRYAMVYFVRILYHTFLFANLLLYVVYIIELQHLERDKKHPIMAISAAIFLIVIISDIVATITGKGFRLNKVGTADVGMNIFLYGYISFIVVIIFLMVAFRNRIYKQAMLGFYGTMAISFMILLLQGKHGTSSYTTSSFLFPVLAMLYIIHSNPYDIELGAINSRALEDMVRYNYNHKNELVYMSLYLPDFDVDGAKFTKELMETVRRFATNFFNYGLLVQVSNGHVILMAQKKRNMDFENRINNILNAFVPEYEKFQYDYKIVYGVTIDEISRKNEYISFIRNIHRNMSMNSVHMVTYDDVTEFNRYEQIISELGDIYRRHDLRDPRVMAYCQPVYNIKTGRYDTAEALMRLKLPEIGLVFPDQFISLAEENGFIHVLTEIMLQKTCDELRYLIAEGYEVSRISVNVSVSELREENFIDDVGRIIEGSNIPYEKVAIELTESMNESDFAIMKNKIDELKEKGIKFYLDDFGTGYSNMERIMELPFDIIKFDRSLVIASSSDERSEKMVGSLANMFKEMGYSVLYEGVENDFDEKRCINMSASYLQGYKYSRPIPIIELNRFFSKLS